MKHFRAWRATARMCLKEKSYFGLANVIAQYLLRAAGLGALLMIWRSLFMQGADMQGLTLNQVYVYTIGAGADARRADAGLRLAP